MIDQQRLGAERPVGSLDGCIVDTVKMGHLKNRQHYHDPFPAGRR